MCCLGSCRAVRCVTGALGVGRAVYNASIPSPSPKAPEKKAGA